MSSSSTRSGMRHTVLYLTARVMILAVGIVVRAWAGEPANSTPDAQTGKSAPAKQAAQPNAAPQTHKSAPSAKSAPQKKKAADANAATKSADAAEKEKKDSVGEPLAAGMMKLLQQEIVAGIRSRGINDRFARFQNYAAGRMNATASGYTGSELTGNCRMRWYNHLMQSMLTAPAEAERFTYELHTAALDKHEGLAHILSIASEKMDQGRRNRARRRRSLRPPRPWKSLSRRSPRPRFPTALRWPP